MDRTEGSILDQITMNLLQDYFFDFTKSGKMFVEKKNFHKKFDFEKKKKKRTN
jgi:hypothetical protein